MKFFKFFIPAAIWFISLRHFISGELAFGQDAASYYDHVKFYLDNLSRGVFPLWDPLWNFGAPNDFFLRRICPYNPFLLLILFFKTIGFSFVVAYRLYLACYFFTGAAGFYLLARRALNDRTAAYAAALMLVFSAQGTRLFDSYFLFIFIPGVWFFYFLTAFTQEPKKLSLLGMTFCLMVLVTTYVPFHFLTIFILFLPGFGILYGPRVGMIFGRYLNFFSSNRRVTLFCLAALIFSLLPGILFFLQTKNSAEIVLPRRHYFLETSNALEVDIKTIEKKNMLEDIVFAWDYGFEHLSKFQYETFYLPVFIYLVLLLGMFTKLNRRLVLFAVWAVLVAVICSPQLPVYRFLYEHGFYFKYFRNPHFFLWLIIMPLLILYAAEQLRLILAEKREGLWRRTLFTFYVTSVHAGFAGWMIMKESASIGTYAVILLSWIFFLLSCFVPDWSRRGAGALGLAALAVLVMAQPVEVFQYLQKNIPRGSLNHYPEYARDDADLSPVREEIRKSIQRRPDVRPEEVNVSEALKVQSPPVYYSTPWYYQLVSHPENSGLQQNLAHKFILYDRVEPASDESFPFEKLFQLFREGLNPALVPEGTLIPVWFAGAEASPRAEPVTTYDDKFRLMRFTVNSLRIETRFDRPKFIVYNDCYHSGWRAFLNGHPAEVVRANYAFKGIWLPAGRNVLDLRFGRPFEYVLNFFLLILFYGIFISLFVFVRRRRPSSGERA